MEEEIDTGKKVVAKAKTAQTKFKCDTSHEYWLRCCHKFFVVQIDETDVQGKN